VVGKDPIEYFALPSMLERGPYLTPDLTNLVFDKSGLILVSYEFPM
jgi:hypothetical protein